MKIKTLPPNTVIADTKTITPSQTHGTRIVEITTGTEDLNACDGLWTKDPQFTLGIKTADCAPIAFWNGDQYGIIHAGWRGLCDGIVEKMCNIFNADFMHKESGLTQVRTPLKAQTQIWVGPLMPEFEIQKDDCYDQIHHKFGDQFFVEKSDKIYFDFKGAIASIIPTAEFDARSTYDTLELASWRRDQDQRRNITIISK